MTASPLVTAIDAILALDEDGELTVFYRDCLIDPDGEHPAASGDPVGIALMQALEAMARVLSGDEDEFADQRHRHELCPVHGFDAAICADNGTTVCEQARETGILPIQWPSIKDILEGGRW